jgi:hypothetical protein
MAALGIREDDLDEQFVRSGGKGGQNVNKVATCVVLRHRQSGLQVKCQEARSQAMNRFLARRLLCEKLDAQRRGMASAVEQARERIRRQKRKRSKRAKDKMLATKHAQGREGPAPPVREVATPHDPRVVDEDGRVVDAVADVARGERQRRGRPGERRDVDRLRAPAVRQTSPLSKAMSSWIRLSSQMSSTFVDWSTVSPNGPGRIRYWLRGTPNSSEKFQSYSSFIVVLPGGSAAADLLRERPDSS